MFSIAVTASDLLPASAGKNAIPTPYCPSAGNGKLATSERNLCGIWMSTPAPSPVSTSAPVAPRCSMRHNAPIPIATMLCDLRPCTSTTNDTPQASCSKRGSYKPLAGGMELCIVVLYIHRTNSGVSEVLTGTTLARMETLARNP